MIDPKTARALGVAQQAPPQTIADYLCRQAGNRTIPTLTSGAANWFVTLAMSLGSHLPDGRETHWADETPAPVMATEAIAKSVSAAHVSELRRADAPMVLAAVAPDVIVGGCPARDLAKMCRALAGRHLETFCLRILECWESEGYIRND